jgi:PAT family beta-lactamase induction signal transducer AmpG
MLPPAERASGTAIFVAMYRVALIVSSAGALILADHLPWSTVYWILAGLMGIGVLTTLLAPPAAEDQAPPRTLREAVVEPIREVLKRDHAAALLAIVMLYKVGDVVASQLLTKFLLDLHFSLTDIGAIRKGLGLGATIAGSLLGGGLVAKWGLRRAMIVFGVLMSTANLLYAALAFEGRSYPLLTVAIGVDNLMNGMGTAAFVAFLMSLCNKKMTATQYALFSSLMTVPGLILASVSGFLAEAVGYPIFFVFTVVAGIPALVLLRTVPLDEPAEG